MVFVVMILKVIYYKNSLMINYRQENVYIIIRLSLIIS